ncbi:MAG: putative porin [Planctomycetota bacterium]
MTILAMVALAQATAQTPQGSIWDRLKFDANGRMRGEATFDNVDSTTGADIDDRYRGRMRFRVGAKYLMDENLTLGARASTASDGNDANNPHWDFGDGDGFNGSGLVMDRFYIDWKSCEDVNVVIGKQPQAFETPNKYLFGDFVWDSDISPSGVALKWAPKTEGPSFDARVAGYVATEVNADEDPKMWGAQGNVYLPVDEAKLHLSTSFQDWKDNENTAVAGNQGNTATTQDFMIWDTFLAGTMPGGPLDEMSGYVEFMNNLDESDQGFVLGAQLGSSAWKKGNYNVFALIYDLDGDAVFSPTAQDDTPVAGTGLNDGDGDGMSGVVFGGQYFWRDNIAFKLWVLTSDPSGADDEPIRLRFDMDFNVK